MEELNLGGSDVTDIRALRGMPLRARSTTDEGERHWDLDRLASHLQNGIGEEVDRPGRRPGIEDEVALLALGDLLRNGAEVLVEGLEAFRAQEILGGGGHNDPGGRYIAYRRLCKRLLHSQVTGANIPILLVL